MATCKSLDDYCLNPSPMAFQKIGAMIGREFVNGIIDRANYDKLLEELQTEIEAARDLFRASWPASR